MKKVFYLIPVVLISCAQKESTKIPTEIIHKQKVKPKEKSKMETYYETHNQDSVSSSYKGKVHQGELINASLFPPQGENFKYFSEKSYLEGRGYVHSEVKEIVLNAFKQLHLTIPDRKFQIMESAGEHGGELWPHRTHQLGTSVDFMLPKMKNKDPYYGLDDKGINHYFLNTDNQGVYQDSDQVEIDFETTAQYILALSEAAKLEGGRIKKVILKVELLDELFETKSGKILKQKNIYFAKRLSKKVNEIHDDHFHIDFEVK